MFHWLNSITTGIMLATIAVTLWLGIFLVTRGGKSRRVWLAALTLWAVGSWFIYDIIQISLPNYGELIWLLWFGQLIKFAPTLWFQLSYQLRLDSGTYQPWQQKLGFIVIVVAYLLTLFNIADTGRYFGTTPFPNEIGSYILFLTLLIVLPLWTMWNFLRVKVLMRLPLWRRQMDHLLVATAIAYVGGLYAGFSIYLRLPIPFFPGHAILGLGIILLGYGLVKYDALLEGRSIERDALYSSAGVGLITLFYAVIAWILWLTGVMAVPAVAILLCFVVITHTLSDGGRALLDHFFYRGNLRRIRTDLRQLSQEAGTGLTLSEKLDLILETVCQTAGTNQGFVATRQLDEEDFEVLASREARWRGQRFSPSALAAGDIEDLLALPSNSHQELAPMVMIVPLRIKHDQIGAILLGSKLSGAHYRAQDLDYLDDVSHQVSTMIEMAWQQEARTKELEASMEKYLEREKSLQQQVQQLVTARSSLPTDVAQLDEETISSLTEDALRHMNDYSYLGTHDFAKLKILEPFLATGNSTPAGGEVKTAMTITHLARGRALNKLLVYAIDQLRPPGPEPSVGVVPTREWHNYVILHDSYVEEILTRDIMARLYIGEGTYNRARRRALHSVGKMIQEMEQQRSQAAESRLAVTNEPVSS